MTSREDDISVLSRVTSSDDTPIFSVITSEVDDTPIFSVITSEVDDAPVFSRITTTDDTGVWRFSTSRTSSTPDDNDDLFTSIIDDVTIASFESDTASSPDVSTSQTESPSSLTVAVTPTATEDTEDSDAADHDLLSNGATAGIVIAAIGLLLALIFLGRWLYKKMKNHQSRRDEERRPSSSGSFDSSAGSSRSAPEQGRAADRDVELREMPPRS